MNKATCHHCQNPCRLTTGKEVYAHRPDLYDLKFWKCTHCIDSFVGCHKPGARVKILGYYEVSDGTLPLGTAANAALRKMRSEAHKVFDPKWKNGRRHRGTAYAILSAMTGISHEQCHISMMSLAQCHKVIEVCERRWE